MKKKLLLNKSIVENKIPIIETMKLKPSIMKKTQKNFQKSLSQTLRYGDWTCLICNNLNFSFRTECNRCKIQTKDKNLIQSLHYFSSKENINNSNEIYKNNIPNVRKALGDITNKQQNFQINNQGGIIMGNIPNNNKENFSYCNQFNYEKETKKKMNYLQPNKGEIRKGFKNMILLMSTPTKLKNEENNEKTPKNEPYKSPNLDLPSLSPIIRECLIEELKPISLEYKFSYEDQYFNEGVQNLETMFKFDMLQFSN